MHICCYGTLKKGYGNHKVVEDAVVSIEPATVAGFMLYSYAVGGIPYAVPTEHGFVQCELIELRDDANLPKVMANLDSLEGHPNHYRRTLVEAVRTRDGLAFPAWIYVAAHAIPYLRPIGAEWPAEAFLDGQVEERETEQETTLEADLENMLDGEPDGLGVSCCCVVDCGSCIFTGEKHSHVADPCPLHPEGVTEIS